MCLMRRTTRKPSFTGHREHRSSTLASLDFTLISSSCGHSLLPLGLKYFSAPADTFQSMPFYRWRNCNSQGHDFPMRYSPQTPGSSLYRNAYHEWFSKPTSHPLRQFPCLPVFSPLPTHFQRHSDLSSYLENGNDVICFRDSRSGRRWSQQISRESSSSWAAA